MCTAEPLNCGGVPLLVCGDGGVLSITGTLGASAFCFLSCFMFCKGIKSKQQIIRDFEVLKQQITIIILSNKVEFISTLTSHASNATLKA